MIYEPPGVMEGKRLLADSSILNILSRLVLIRLYLLSMRFNNYDIVNLGPTTLTESFSCLRITGSFYVSRDLEFSLSGEVAS